MTAREKFKVNFSTLNRDQIMIMKSYLKTGEAHMEYYHRTMKAFKYPEWRLKCFDTVEYEEMIPQVKKILADYELMKALPEENE